MEERNKKHWYSYVLTWKLMVVSVYYAVNGRGQIPYRSRNEETRKHVEEWVEESCNDWCNLTVWAKGYPHHAIVREGDKSDEHKVHVPTKFYWGPFKIHHGISDGWVDDCLENNIRQLY